MPNGEVAPSWRGRETEEDGEMPQNEYVPDKLTDRVLVRLPWLDRLADTVQTATAPVLGPRGPKRLQDALNGVWFGHPLHAALVVAPLGAWTATLLLDVAGLEEGADLCLKAGVAGALGAAATGAAQWQDTQGKPRRLGMLHAGLNITLTGLYTGSWLLRARGARKAGIAASTLGYAIGGVSAWLGGELSYDLGIGVNRTAFEEPPTEWTAVADAGELEENTPRRVAANGVPIMLLRRGTETSAISATCAHLGGPLDEGVIDGETVTCPWHGSVFCVTDGKLLHGPATMPQPAYDVRVQDGTIAVRARDLGRR